MRTVRQLWSILDRPQRRGLLWLQALSLLMAVATLAGIAAVLPLFSAIADPHGITQSPILAALYRGLHFSGVRPFQVALAIGFCALVLLSNAITFLGTILMTRYAYQVSNSLHVLLFRHYLRKDYPFHLSRGAAGLANRTLGEVDRATVGIVQNLLLLGAGAATAALIVLAILLLHPLLACLTLLLLGATYVVIYRRVDRRLLRNGLLESRFMERRIGVITECFAAVKEILSSGAQEPYVRHVARSSEIIAHTAIDTLAISQAPRHILECLTVVGLAAAALSLSSGGPDPAWFGQLTFIGFAAYRLLGAAQQVFSMMVRIRADVPALTGICADVGEARAAVAASDWQPPSPSSRWLGRPTRAIEVDAVTFRYAANRPPAVADATLRIPAGSIAGFTGENGAGKTTMADLIVGLLAPQSGSIAIDGAALDDSNRRDWLAGVAYVPQQAALINGSIAENIAFGVQCDDIDPVRLTAAARMAHVGPLLDRLPLGFATPVGERGVRLSGGQRQRIALARALYRNASLIVLDEATEAIDAASEDGLLGSLALLRGQTTVIIVAHRPDVLRHCDVLFEFKRGRIVGVRQCQPERRLRSPMPPRIVRSALSASSAKESGEAT